MEAGLCPQEQSSWGGSPRVPGPAVWSQEIRLEGGGPRHLGGGPEWARGQGE